MQAPLISQMRRGTLQYCVLALLATEERYGFDIVFTSETTSMGGPELVYLLRWPSDEVRAKAWKEFLSDPEWIAIKKSTAAKYGDLVEGVQDRQLQLTPYTPAASTVP